MTGTEFEKYIHLISEGKRAEAEILRIKDIPNTLIKHFWLNGDDSDEKKFYTLENNMLWFSAVSELNDPYEFKGIVVNEEVLEDKGYPKYYIEKLKEFLSMKEYGVVCLSERNIDYLPMWAYYTNNYKGYCVEYEVIDKLHIHKVQYEPKRMLIASLLFQMRDAVKEAFQKSERTSPEADKIAMILLQNLYIKGESWNHEKEYRIVCPIDIEIGKNIEISTVGLRVKRIIAGVNCSESNKKRLNLISNKIGCSNIYVSHLSAEKYGMDIERM